MPQQSVLSCPSLRSIGVPGGGGGGQGTLVLVWEVKLDAMWPGNGRKLLVAASWRRNTSVQMTQQLYRMASSVAMLDTEGLIDMYCSMSTHMREGDNFEK